MLFWVWEDAGCGLPEVLPFICTPALGQPPGLSHPQGSGTGEGRTLRAAGRGQVVLPEGPWVGWLQGLVITAAFVDGRGWLSFLRLHLPESTGGTLCGCTFFILLPYQDESCIYHF